MDAAGEAGAGGAAGAAGAAAGSGADGAGGQAGAAGAGDGTASASAGTGGAATTALGSAAAASGASNLDWLPEKYRVAAADGSVDLSASAQKLAGGYGELSKRFGDGGAPPKDATEYTVTVPDALKEAVGDLSKDEMYGKFRADMHGLGLTQKQFDGVMNRYFELAPQLVAGGVQLSSEQCIADLKKTWADDKAFGDNIKLSYRAGNALAQAAGMSFDDLEKAGLANNPTFIKMMAKIGPEFGEDTATSDGQSAGFASEDEIKSLMASEAYHSKKHADHQKTVAKVTAYYERKYGTHPVS